MAPARAGVVQRRPVPGSSNVQAPEYTEPTAARLIICKSKPCHYNAGQKETFPHARNLQSRCPERIQNSDRAA